MSEPIMEGMFGRLIEMIIEWFDEYYSVNLSGEVLRGMKEKALRQGYQLRPCLGYDAAGGGKPYTINESEYAAVSYTHLELGHVILKTKSEMLCDIFASHILAPRILVHKFGCRNAEQILSLIHILELVLQGVVTITPGVTQRL